MADDPFSWYKINSYPLSEIFQYKCSEVEIHFDKKFGKFHNALIILIDNTYKYSNHHAWLLANPSIAKIPKYSPLISSAVVKNYFVLYSALLLNRRGLYGPARTLLRFTFEYLVVAKYCAISQDDRVFQRWRRHPFLSSRQL